MNSKDPNNNKIVKKNIPMKKFEDDHDEDEIAPLLQSLSFASVVATGGEDESRFGTIGKRESNAQETNENSHQTELYRLDNNTESKDFPFLQKIFQTLFAQPEFVNFAFSDPNYQNRNNLPVLYQMIIKQLLFDGYGSVAHELQKKINPTVSAMSVSPEPALYKLLSIFLWLETRSQQDVAFSNLLNWFLKNQYSCGQTEIHPKTIATSEEMGVATSLRVSGAVGNHNCSPVASTSAGDITGDLAKSISVPVEGESVGPAKPLQVVYKFGQLGDGPGCLDTPHGFCLGLNNDIVVADTNNHRISVFTLEGQFKFSFGEFGLEDGKLNQPRKIAMMPPVHLLNPILDDRPPVFVVCDRGSKRSRMQLFSMEGHFIRVVEVFSMDIVSGLTTTPDRKIVLVDSVRGYVIAFTEEGQPMNWFNCTPHMIEPSDVAVHNNHFYVCDFKGHCVAVFNAHGQFVQKLSAKMLKFPNGIEISDYGDIICGDSHGNRFHISVFNPDGKLMADFDCPFLKVSRCCGVRLSKSGRVITLAKNNNHVVVMESVLISSPK